MALKDNLKRIREERRLSQSGLAKLASVSQQLVSRLESGVDLTTKRLPEIARALNVSAYEIDENFSPEDTSSVVTAPLISWVSAGQIETPDMATFDGDTERRAAAGLDPKGTWIALKVKGDSMDRISPPDSIVFVNLKDRRLVPNACYVIQDAEGGSSYKRYRPGRWEAVSTNPKYKPYLVKGDRGPVVIGRVKRTVLDL
jgi:transcriptional regulator with XRE-family HTH domain